jgi:ABC-type bacteriocin/lantibiotic exporter with double-glycine peptidase domain
VLSVAGYMLIVDPLVAAVALAFFVPSIVLLVVLQPRLNRLTANKTEAQRELGEAILEEDRTVADADAAGGTKIDRLIDQMYGLKIKIALLKYALKFANNLLGHLGPLSVLVVGGWLVIEGQTALGTIVAFISGYDKMSEPARDLLNFYRRLSMMKVQYGMLREAAGGGGEPTTP